MDTLHVKFLHILKTALLGGQAEDPELTEQQWEALVVMAGQHKVLPMIFEAIRGIPALQNTSFLAELRQRSRQHILLQTRKSWDFLYLYTKLREAGVTPLVVKGIICRKLYPQMDHRASSDEDLLVGEEQFARCSQVMTELGMHTEATPEQMETDYEIPYHSTTGPLFIELHKWLFPPESEAYGDWNRFFDKALENAVFETVDGVSIATLAPTEHLFYLILHAMKHFLHGGFGIRQICDIVLYANAWGNRVDWDRLLMQCQQIRAEYFTAALFQIGQNYLVFDPVKACCGEMWQQLQVSEENLLRDVLLGGVYGSSTMSRRHSSSMTLSAAEAGKQNRKTGSGLRQSLFPSSSKLRRRYPWLKKAPWLLPVAWADRILRYGLQTGRGEDNSAAESWKIGNERIALMREYKII